MSKEPNFIGLFTRFPRPLLLSVGVLVHMVPVGRLSCGK